MIDVDCILLFISNTIDHQSCLSQSKQRIEFVRPMRILDFVDGFDVLMASIVNGLERKQLSSVNFETVFSKTHLIASST